MTADVRSRANAGAAFSETPAVESTQAEYSHQEIEKAQEQVRRFQSRIVKAAQEGRWNKVKALQHLLTHSYSGRVMAVHRVTHNDGSKTPGVDGET